MLMRFDPFREIDRLTQQVWGAAARPLGFPMDAYRHGDEFIVRFDLPGGDASSIDLTVEKNVLTVTAKREFTVPEGADVIVAERPQGTFTRQLLLGDALDTGSVQADYDNGVLTVKLSVAEQAKPHKVEISGGRKQKELAGAAG